MKKILLVLIVLKATQPCFSQGTLKIPLLSWVCNSGLPCSL